MPWPVGNDMGLDGETDQCKIPNYIQQFVACRFIGEPEFKIVEVSFAFDFNIVFFENTGQPAHFLIGYRLVNHNNGIVDVSTFDEIIGQ